MLQGRTIKCSRQNTRAWNLSTQTSLVSQTSSQSIQVQTGTKRLLVLAQGIFSDLSWRMKVKLHPAWRCGLRASTFQNRKHSTMHRSCSHSMEFHCYLAVWSGYSLVFLLPSKKAILLLHRKKMKVCSSPSVKMLLNWKRSSPNSLQVNTGMKPLRCL